jgi:triacylglycerol lipase
LLARLQQFLVLGVIASASIWLAAGLMLDRPGWGLAGALALAAGYAVVLGVEFFLLRWVSADDAAPRPTAWQLTRAWWGEVRSAPLVFAWRQPFRSQRWPDLLPRQAHGQRGVLLVHGFVCNRGLWNAWLARLSARGTAVVAVSLEPVFGSISHYAASIEAAVQRLHDCTGQAPLIVAHSMGGLAVRRWWAEQADNSRVYRLITIGTPHHGTWLARFAFSLNGRQMRPQSSWLRDLAKKEPADRAALITCFYGHCDNIVFPPSTATLMGANNIHLPGVAHVHMVDQPEPWQEALQCLESSAST